MNSDTSKEKLDALLEMSPEAACELSQMIYKQMETFDEDGLSAILERIFSLGLVRAHSLIELIGKNKPHFNSSLYEKLLNHSMVDKWITQNREELLKNTSI